MSAIVYKWLIVFAFSCFIGGHHPVFVSVTSIEHNPVSKALEISCKIFTTDFEATLRKKYHSKVDLLDVKVKTGMNKIVDDYIQKHLIIVADGKMVSLQFLGFEQDEDGIISYFEVKNIATLKKLQLVNNILYEYYTQQMGIIHVVVKGERKSSRLNNPDSTVSFLF